MVGDHRLSGCTIDTCVGEFVLCSNGGGHALKGFDGRFLSASLEAALGLGGGGFELLTSYIQVRLSRAALPGSLEFFDGALLVRIDLGVLHHGCHGRLEQGVAAALLSARGHLP